MPVYATFNFTPYFTNLHGVFCTLFALLATARFPDHFLTRALWCATVMCGRTASFWFLFLGTGVVALLPDVVAK
jgi:general stress protein CsbA